MKTRNKKHETSTSPVTGLTLVMFDAGQVKTL